MINRRISITVVTGPLSLRQQRFTIAFFDRFATVPRQKKQNKKTSASDLSTTADENHDMPLVGLG